MRVARDNSLRLLRIVNDLLELGRLESEEFRLAPEPVELTDFAAAQVESMRKLATLKHIVLEFEPAGERFWVCVDPALGAVPEFLAGNLSWDRDRDPSFLCIDTH